MCSQNGTHVRNQCLCITPQMHACMVGEESIERGPTKCPLTYNGQPRLHPTGSAAGNTGQVTSALLTCNLYSQIVGDDTVPGCYVPTRSTQVKWVTLGALHRTNKNVRPIGSQWVLT